MKVSGYEHWRIQEFEKGGPYGEREARSYNGGMGALPPVGPGAKPLVRGTGGKAPLKLNVFI